MDFWAKNFATFLFSDIELCVISYFDPWVEWNKKTGQTKLFDPKSFLCITLMNNLIQCMAESRVAAADLQRGQPGALGQ